MHVKSNLAAKIRSAAFTKRNVRYYNGYLKKKNWKDTCTTHVLKETDMGSDSIPDFGIFNISNAMFPADLLYNFTDSRIMYM